jgi:hypothetical protein
MLLILCLADLISGFVDPWHPMTGSWRCWLFIATEPGALQDVHKAVHPHIRLPVIDFLCSSDLQYDSAFEDACCSQPLKVPVRVDSSLLLDTADEWFAGTNNLDELGRHFYFGLAHPVAQEGDKMSLIIPEEGSLDYHFGGDKASHAHDYLRLYQTLFAVYGTSASVLEIGVNTGESLAVWSVWFPDGLVIGNDIRSGMFDVFWPRLADAGANATGNTFILFGDLMLEENLNALRKLANFDIVIDDADHSARGTILRFIFLFPDPAVLKRGGTYSIEDIGRPNFEIYEFFTILAAVALRPKPTYAKSKIHEESFSHENAKFQHSRHKLEEYIQKLAEKYDIWQESLFSFVNDIENDLVDTVTFTGERIIITKTPA